MELRFALGVAPFLILLGLVASAAEPGQLSCAGAKVYPSPTEPAIENAVVVIDEGRIRTVAPADRAAAVLPRSGVALNCAGKVVVAGFWNSHVHFAAQWNNASAAPANKLAAQMQDMLTRWGFTTVWDLGSDPGNTLALRARVVAGEIAGPMILMAGDIFPKNGHPIYLPAELQLPEAATPQQAQQMAQRYLKLGLDGIKLFTGAYMGQRKPVINMDAAIAKAAVDVAHAKGLPVFTHPQNRAGVDNALAAGVDILAHTIPSEGSFTALELEQMKRQHTALIPTLTLWTTVVDDPAVADSLVRAGVDELKSYASAGGTILFGTDVGFTSKYDTTPEFEFMGRAMDWRGVLASLTTIPAALFKATTKGRVEQGMDADLVVLDADPAIDVRNFAKVAYTLRQGKVIYRK